MRENAPGAVQPRSTAPVPPSSSPTTPASGSSLVAALVRLARPAQWSKGAFVFLGALYSQKLLTSQGLWPAIGAFAAFGFASSACYVFNDLRDAPLDRLHPRKKRRPIAAGVVSPRLAAGYGMVLAVLAFAASFLIPEFPTSAVPAAAWARELLAGAVALYILNTLAYTFWLKNAPVADVISLAMGFVLRVLGGCAAVAVEPSTWLLNCTFFLSMFLAFGKRLGERQSLGDGEAAAARTVQALYTADLLRMATVVTAVATLLTYAGYVQDQAERYTRGFNLLWLTVLPATYGLLRCMLMVDRGVFDDPTELATRDRPFQFAAMVFGALSVALIATFPA